MIFDFFLIYFFNTFYELWIEWTILNVFLERLELYPSRLQFFDTVAVYIHCVIKWQMFKGSTNLNLFEGGLCLKKKIILRAFQLCCTLHVFRMYERGKTLAGRMFQVRGMCLNLQLLNQRADSGSFSFYYPLETYSEYYVIKLGKGRACTDSWTKATQTAVPVQTAVRLFVSEKLGRPR